MQNPVFLLKDPLLAGSYLLGRYAWAEDMRLETAVLLATPPVTGEVTLTLEVNGALTNKFFTLAPSALPEVRLTLNLGVKVLAGQTVRWQVTAFAGAPEDAAYRAALTLQVNREVDTIIASPEMSVWWVNGPLEKFKLFTYDPATAAFTEVSAGIATGRAVITPGGTFSISIAGDEALRVAAATLYTAALVAGGLALATAPQLQFYVGLAPVATLTQTGALFVAGAQQLTPVDQTGQFLLGSGAALNAAGVLAENFSQPL